MGYPKFIKETSPLDPLCLVGVPSVMKWQRVGKDLWTFNRQFPHHIKNTGDFVQQMRGITLQSNEYIASYDVSALYTSVPIDTAINIIRGRLELDQEFHLRTTI